MKSEFTKGPWEVDNFATPVIVNTPVIVGSDSKEEPLFIIHGQNADANARLISAAPDMFTALKECVEALGDILGASGNGQPYTTEEIYRIFTPFATMGTAALNKATDGQYNEHAL